MGIGGTANTCPPTERLPGWEISGSRTVGGLQGLCWLLLVSRHALIPPQVLTHIQVWGQMPSALYKYPLSFRRLQTIRLVTYKVARHIHSVIIGSDD